MCLTKREKKRKNVIPEKTVVKFMDYEVLTFKDSKGVRKNKIRPYCPSR